MDKRKTYICVLDTETCNSLTTEDGKIDLSQSLVYDIGYQIIDKKGNVYLKRSFMVADFFIGEKELMKSAYFADKIPQYWKDYKQGKRKLKLFKHIRWILKEDLKNFNCSIICAHNANFDLTALNNTQRYLTCSKWRWFFPYGVEIWDSLLMARDTIGKQKSYTAYCQKNGYMTKHKTPQVRLTAEILYRYLSGDENFEESHTGLEDVEIESTILVSCLKQHKKMQKSLTD